MQDDSYRQHKMQPPELLLHMHRDYSSRLRLEQAISTEGYAEYETQVASNNQQRAR